MLQLQLMSDWVTSYGKWVNRDNDDEFAGFNLHTHVKLTGKFEFY